MKKIDTAQLYDEHFNAVFGYVSFRVATQQDAEDVVSEVFIKVVKNIVQFKPKRGATIRSWIFAITRNTLIDFYRKSGKEAHAIDIDEVDQDVQSDASVIEDAIDMNITFEQLREYIQALPQRQQEILLLRYSADLSNKEIAVTLNINQRSVSAALSKAIQSLRVQMSNTQQ